MMELEASDTPILRTFESASLEMMTCDESVELDELQSMSSRTQFCSVWSMMMEELGAEEVST
jgi:hypothetical protein